jgi:hypothetical protein
MNAHRTVFRLALAGVGVFVALLAVAVPAWAVEGVLTDPASGVSSASATLNGSLEPDGLDTHAWFEYGLSETYEFATAHQDAGEANEAVPFSAAVSGLEPNTTYHYRLAAESSSGISYGADETLTTQALPEIIALSPASNISRIAATISARLNPEKSDTKFEILYGETASYGQHSLEFDAGSALGEASVSVGLLSLEPGKTYHYTIEATNQAGTATGPDETFTTAPATPPVAVTGGASNVMLTTATVAGMIDPAGLPTSYELDFGTSAEYGTSIFGEAGEGGEQDVTVEIPLQYLAPETTYHYRLVAINSDGRSFGADQTFTTPVYYNPIVLPATAPQLQTPTITFPVEAAPTHSKRTTKPRKHAKGRARGKHTKGRARGKRRGRSTLRGRKRRS